MQRTLGEHITHLEKKIDTLNHLLTLPGTTVLERNVIEIDLGIAGRALIHFKKALELEQKLGQEPPENSN